MAAVSNLPYLIRLLDDRDPAVCSVVIEQISSFGGDISHDLAALGIHMGTAEKKRLTDILAPGRRATLRDEWLVPSDGASAMADDWEGFENILRQISDFLHDGITLRPSLSDNIDLLVEEILNDISHPSEDDVRRWLFVKDTFKGAQKAADSAKYFDLCYVIENRVGNPTSLGCMFMLVSARLGLDVEGCNYPGHFLNRIIVDDEYHLVDCFHAGRLFQVEKLLHAHPEISLKAKTAVSSASHLGVILLRYLAEIESTFKGMGKLEDVELFHELAGTLHQ
ncbi:MAG: transglutaminase family protein [Akkermansiaceae bacterium]